MCFGIINEVDIFLRNYALTKINRKHEIMFKTNSSFQMQFSVTNFDIHNHIVLCGKASVLIYMTQNAKLGTKIEK